MGAMVQQQISQERDQPSDAHLCRVKFEHVFLPQNSTQKLLEAAWRAMQHELTTCVRIRNNVCVHDRAICGRVEIFFAASEKCAREIKANARESLRAGSHHSRFNFDPKIFFAMPQVFRCDRHLNV